MASKWTAETGKGPRVLLPCCGEWINATGRKSKQAERPRNHRCPKCGESYRIDAANGKVIGIGKGVS